jgi:hypothetical protein
MLTNTWQESRRHAWVLAVGLVAGLLLWLCRVIGHIDPAVSTRISATAIAGVFLATALLGASLARRVVLAGQGATATSDLWVSTHSAGCLLALGAWCLLLAPWLLWPWPHANVFDGAFTALAAALLVIALPAGLGIVLRSAARLFGARLALSLVLGLLFCILALITGWKILWAGLLAQSELVGGVVSLTVILVLAVSIHFTVLERRPSRGPLALTLHLWMPLFALLVVTYAYVGWKSHPSPRHLSAPWTIEAAPEGAHWGLVSGRTIGPGRMTRRFLIDLARKRFIRFPLGWRPMVVSRDRVFWMASVADSGISHARIVALDVNRANPVPWQTAAEFGHTLCEHQMQGYASPDGRWLVLARPLAYGRLRCPDGIFDVSTGTRSRLDRTPKAVTFPDDATIRFHHATDESGTSEIIDFDCRRRTFGEARLVQEPVPAGSLAKTDSRRASLRDSRFASLQGLDLQELRFSEAQWEGWDGANYGRGQASR